MKRKLFPIGLVLMSSILSFTSCSKDKKVECPPTVSNAPYIPPTLFFNIVDKNTAQDLFFSDNPPYSVKQVIYFYKVYTNNGDIIDTLPVYIDSTRKCLQLAKQYSIGDSAFLKIANQAVDTLIFGVIKGLQITPCSMMNYVDYLNFDGVDYVAGANQIITLKK